MIHLIVGLVTLCLGAWGIIAWWSQFGYVLRGLIPILLVLLGLAAVGAGLQRTIGEAEDEEADPHAGASGPGESGRRAASGPARGEEPGADQDRSVPAWKLPA